MRDVRDKRSLIHAIDQAMGIVPANDASVIAVCNESEKTALAEAIMQGDVLGATIEVS